MHVAGFNLVSVSLNFQFCQCQTQLSVSVSISFFRFWLYCIDSKLLLRYPYLSLSYAPWSEGGCLSSAKLRSTDSVNPRAVLSRVLPRYRLYSKHRDRQYRYQGTRDLVFRTHEQSLLLEQAKEQRRRAAIGDQQPFAPPYRRLE